MADRGGPDLPSRCSYVRALMPLTVGTYGSYHMSYSLNYLRGIYRGLYRAVLQGLLREILGV